MATKINVRKKVLRQMIKEEMDLLTSSNDSELATNMREEVEKKIKNVENKASKMLDESKKGPFYYSNLYKLNKKLDELNALIGGTNVK